jgi:hypothetical protein
MEKISGVLHPRARQAVHNNAKIAYKTSTHKIARSARVLWENYMGYNNRLHTSIRKENSKKTKNRRVRFEQTSQSSTPQK